tara:strand:+ start:856 stop:1671 length:816 start_codon:yes stop_codon:yes gene_type:complete
MYKAHIVTSSAATIITDDETLTVPFSHMAFNRVKEALGLGDYEEAINLSNAAKVVDDFGNGDIYVRDGVVYYKDKELHNSITKRIKDMISNGHDSEAMLTFLGNLMDNTSGRAIKELYRFLECNNLPITEDGCFLAYKNVRSNYRDKHSDTYDNTVGSVCEMPRNEVMDDPSQTCSTGLHFCSMEYLTSMWGTSGHTMIIKINPADVVSIPLDYNNSKGRCCKYEVIAEHLNGVEDSLSNTPVWDDYPEGYDSGYDDGYDAGLAVGLNDAA